ncbi:MAG TPA: hypothetical protein VFR42_08100, partial [Candidatus Acidoferrum sp.]|nr:hypothetical protein [Candidatus Acidoferrum sp.]
DSRPVQPLTRYKLGTATMVDAHELDQVPQIPGFYSPLRMEFSGQRKIWSRLPSQERNASTSGE